MKTPAKHQFVSVLFFLSLSMFAACERKPAALVSPANVHIAVAGRIMTVTWDEVKNAQGYVIVLTSEGCASGNRTINTVEKTAVITSSGNSASNVEITGETSIKITLMAARGDPDSAMAKAVTAKVMSLGGTVKKRVYIDSDYSQEIRLAL